MTRPAVNLVRPSDKLVRADRRYSTCPACGRRGFLTDGKCAPPREVACAKRALKRAVRALG